MKYIKLTQGYRTIVDDDDYELLSRYTWHVVIKPTNKYARRAWRDNENKVKQIFMHVQLMGEVGIDHKNGNGLDNRRSNLRLSTQRQNNHNIQVIYGISKFKGVCKGYKDSWYARIRDPTTGKKLHLGTFKTEEDAAKAYDSKALELFGEFAWTNFHSL